MGIVRTRFAILDISDNYAFSFASNMRDEDLYPGKANYLLSVSIKS